jgi:UDP-GlcNAc:undecaprenyl-phosphate GlcNAc-1-phosphate transferase
MATYQQLLTAFIAVLAAAAISFVLTPIVRRFALAHGFVDIPKDSRRMHHKPIPTIGGLAIYAAFVLVVLVMSGLNRQLVGMLIGGTIVVLLGIVDDKYDLNAKLKFIVQILAAIVPVSQGCVIRYISNPLPMADYPYLPLKFLAVPVTILWIVAITNAVNFIDGLDGLSVGVCSISCLSMAIIALSLGQASEAVILAALLGACLGFLPYNLNPAKIFMGDTGATFLGFTLACMSVSGLFKLYTVISFAVPILVLGVPLFDISFACLRRIWNHVSPMHPDRSHIHHRLIDRGLSQRQSVAVLYVAASLLGLCAVMISTSGPGKALMILLAVIAIGVISLRLLSRSQPDKKKDAAKK